MNTIKWETKRYFRSVLTWTIAISALQFIYAAIYPSFVNEKEMMIRWTKMMPQTLMKFFGFETLDLSNILNYYAAISSFYVNLMGSIFATFVGVRALSREEIEKTAEFLLTRPVSRTRIVSLKLLACTIQILIFDGVTGTLSMIFLNMYKTGDFSTSKFWILWLSQLLLHLTIMNLSFFIGAVQKKPEIAVSLSLAAMAGLYVINALSKITETLRIVGYLTPYFYADSSRIIKHGFGNIFVIYFVLVNTLLILLCLMIYRKKDILL